MVGIPDGEKEIEGALDGSIVGAVGKSEGDDVGEVGFPDGDGDGLGLEVGKVEG